MENNGLFGQHKGELLFIVSSDIPSLVASNDNDKIPKMKLPWLSMGDTYVFDSALRVPKLDEITLGGFGR